MKINITKSINLIIIFVVLSSCKFLNGDNNDDNSIIIAPTPLPPIVATIETEPVPTSGDAADDPSIWVHQTDPSLSLIIGTDSNAGLGVYDLLGNQLQFLNAGKINNQDLRYNFSLNFESVSIIIGSKQDDNSIAIFKVNSTTRTIEDVSARAIITGLESVLGACMYCSSNKYYAIISDYNGNIEQWQLHDAGNGKIDAILVRTIAVGSMTEGCVADDELGYLYISEEKIGIWKYGAEPNSNSNRTLVDAVGEYLTADIEGLALYYGSDGRGYLIASSQGSSSYVVYEREGDNNYVGTFQIAPNTIKGIDGTSITDGIDVTSFSLGPNFPYGVFVAQDDKNTDPDANQNFKLVPWEYIAFNLNLMIDISIDPYN